MSGVTKHIYDRNIINIKQMWGKQLKCIAGLLQKEYTEQDVIDLLKRFYPYEWEFVEQMYSYYAVKDRFLEKRKGKKRYCMLKPEELIKRVPGFRTMLMPKYMEKHKLEFYEGQRAFAEQQLLAVRSPKIERIRCKIENALLKTQQVTPDFLDKLMGLYSRKNTAQLDRLYIIRELKKYYNKKVIQFFLKLNDTEINRQLREEAFFHLQSFNYQPRLRKQKYMIPHIKNRKKKQYLRREYAYQTSKIAGTPEELEYRIENAKEQQIKTYDYFISHSSKDSKWVQQLILEENKQNKNIFCDWINDADYLKRHLVCEDTLKVIEWRLQQSDALIFVESENSKQSIWCKYELNYFRALEKNIYVITLDDIKNGHYQLTGLTSDWFVDSDYKNLALLEGRKGKVN